MKLTSKLEIDRMQDVAGFCHRCRKPVAYAMNGMIQGVTVGMSIRGDQVVDPGKLYHFNCHSVEIADLPWKKSNKTTEYSLRLSSAP